MHWEGEGSWLSWELAGGAAHSSPRVVAVCQGLLYFRSLLIASGDSVPLDEGRVLGLYVHQLAQEEGSDSTLP